MEYEMKIAGLTRKLPLFPVGEDMSIAAFIIFGDVEMTVAAAKELLKKAPEHDVLLTAEAKSIPLIHEIAKQEGVNSYVIARKQPKVYMKNLLSIEVSSITTLHMQHLYLGEDDANMIKGKKVLIIDDVISTGESLKAMEKLVAKAGGEIAGKMAVLAEGDAMKRDDIIYLEELPLFDAEGNVKD